MRSSQDLRGLNGSNRCVERAFRDERLWPMSVTATESWVGWNACRRLQCRRRLDLDSQPRPRPWLSFSVRTRSRGGDVCFWHKADIRHDLLFVRFRGEADIQSGFMSTRPSTTLADLLRPPLVANPFSAVRASLRRGSSDEFENSLAHGGQGWVRRRPVDCFFPALLF